MDSRNYESKSISFLTGKIKCTSILSNIKTHFLIPSSGYLQMSIDQINPFINYLYLFKSINEKPLICLKVNYLN